jgi:hypothetical protein
MKMENNQPKEGYLPSITNDNGNPNHPEYEELEELALKFGGTNNYIIKGNSVYRYGKKEPCGTMEDFCRYKKLIKKNSAKHNKKEDEEKKAHKFFRESYKNGE